MSRKITSFLALLLMMFVSTSAWAQAEDFGQKTVTIGVAVDSFEPNTWYFLHQGRVSGGGDGLCDIGSNPTMGGIMTDMGIGNNLIKRTLDDVPEGSLATSKAAYLVRFIPVEDAESGDVFRVQFGTGNWLTAPAGQGNSKTITTTDNKYDAGTYNIYYIEDEDAPGHIGINVSDSRGDYQEQIDNNGVNQTIVTWSNGLKTVATGSNSTWSIIDIEWGEYDPREALLFELSETKTTYQSYLGDLVPGTDPGQYSEEALNAFKAALDAADTDANPDLAESLTEDEIRKLIQDIKDTYEAVLATKVPMSLADGYYRIRTGLVYTQEIENEETFETEEVEVPKYMYVTTSGDQINGKWGTPDNVESDCPSLWKITALEDGTFDIVSAATDARFNNVSRSNPVTLSATSENMMAIEPVVTLDGVTYVNIRVSTQAANDFLYLHQGGHNNGSGTDGNLVGWSTSYTANDGPRGSEWFFVPVSAEDADAIIKAYEPIRNHEAMLVQYDSILTNAKHNLEIAIDLKHVNLIESVDQLSSPYNEPSEGSLANLLDGDASTFWHSNWSDGSVEGGIHYLQADLIKPVEEEIYITFTRRPVSNDHVTSMSVYGTNDFEAGKESCELLLEWQTPYTSNTESLKSELFSTKGYQYIRVYAEATTNSRGYWHMSEFQLGYDAPNDNAQVKFMGDLADNLQAVIDEQAELERDDIQLEQYNALKAAYDAFMAKFVDPTALRETLANVKGTEEIVVVGTNPGFWSADNGAAAFKALYDEAVAYDAKGDYTPAQSQNYVESLTSQRADIYASANQVKTGKWYKIRFATAKESDDDEDGEFDKYGWDKVAGNGTTDGKVLPLFGKYITMANFFADEEGYQTIESIDADEVGLGSNLRFMSEDDINDMDGALFRFIAVGDSAYIMQHKATGLFIKAAGTSGAVTLSAHPSLFNSRAIGYGLCVFAAKSITGVKQSYLHAQVNQNLLVTWDVDYPGSRSGLYIEEAEDVDGSYDGSEFNLPMLDGQVKTYCFPVEISAVEGGDAQMWGVNKLEGTKITLAKVEKAVGGRPFILIKGDMEDYDADADVEMAVLKHGNDITALEPQTEGALKGSYYGQTVGAGVIVAEGNALVLSKKSATAIGNNSAYISEGEPFTDLEAEVEVIFSDAPDGITTALANISKSGAAYTIDGRLISEKATLNDLSRFGKGMYILNGTKVVVK